MKILVTGGAGYIGMSLIHRLMDNENISEILIYDNLSRSNYSFFIGHKFSHPDKVKLVRGDLMDTHKLYDSLEGVDVVLHLAAKVTTPFSDKEAHAYDQINHWGTAQLANAIEEKNVPRVVYLSSASIYGDTEEPVSEFYTPKPNTFYGISKYAGEQQISRMKAEREVYILRAANVYGYNTAMRIDAVINRFMFLANYQGRITVNGQGNQYRSFIHVAKLSETIAKLVDTDLNPGIYNLAEHNLDIKTLAQEVKNIYPEVEIMSINHNMTLRSIKIKTPCKLQERLPFTPRSFQEELEELKSHFSF